MTIPALLAKLEAKIDAFNAAPVAPSAELTAQISTLTATVASLTGERDGFKAQVDTLTSQVTALTGERDAAKAESATALATADTLRSEAKTADAKALEILAALGVPPAPGGTGKGAQGSAKEDPAAGKTGLAKFSAVIAAKQPEILK
jgi:outer membrane murein-binding lipoprotein Lpp